MNVHASKRAIIACRMLEAELERAKKETAVDYPVFYLPRALHNQPTTLNAKLKETLHLVPASIDTVLFAYGYCGGSLDGLGSKDKTLIFPLTADCIGLWLSDKNVDERRHDTMYFTPDWTKDEGYIGHEYARVKRERGEQRAKNVFARYVKGYESLSFLDTGASSDLEKQKAEAQLQETAATLNLTFTRSQGSIQMLKKLLTGPWDRNFLIVRPGDSLHLLSYLEALEQIE